MKFGRYTFRSLMMILCTLPLLAGCKDLIDDNLDDCAPELAITYELRLVTNIQTEMATELDQPGDSYVRSSLENYLKNIFTDYAHDLDLSFYDMVGENPLLHHESEIMNASQTSYTLHLPVHNYMHNAAANIQGNGVVTLENEGLGHGSSLDQTVGTKSSLMLSAPASDSVYTHKTGLFIGRLKEMDIKAGVKEQVFKVTLSMANSATALVIDTIGSGLKDIKVFSTGFAIGFKLADSVYNYPSSSPIVINDELNVSGGTQRCFASVNYPSKDIPRTMVVIETTDPFVSVGGTETLWAWICYATLPDGSITRSVLSVKKPLRPGQLEIVKARAYDNGKIDTNAPMVGVSVTLDWNPGGHYDPIL